MRAYQAIRHALSSRFRVARSSLLAIILFQWLFMAPSLAADTSDSIFSLKEMTPVMTFNLKVANDTGDRAWEKRRPQVSGIIADYQPLFIGTQEGLSRQLQDLKQDLPEYRTLGVSRRGDATDEHAALFYDSRRAKPLRHGDFWLSETPQKAGSIMAGDGHPRVVTWGEFAVEGKNKPTYVFNTHLALDESAAVKQADVFLKQVAAIAPKDAEILITGDFNARRNGKVWNRFAEAGFADALQLADHKSGPDHTSHCWAGEDADKEKRRLERDGHKVDMVDWIFHRNGEKAVSHPLLAQVIDSHEGGVYPSDHYPLVLTSLGRAKAELKGYSTAGSLRTAPDSPISLSTTLENSGARGIVPVQLKEDGKATQTRWIPVDGKAEKTLTFKTRLYASGEHTLGIGDLNPVDVSVTNAPARMAFEDLYLDPYPKAGEDTAIFGTVKNTGGKQEVAIVELKVDGNIVSSDGVSLKPGESREMQFSNAFLEEGAYTVSLGDREQEVNVMRGLGSQWRFAKGDDAAR
ncbi:MAG: endonuclease/exonuclease/phosphatase family protein, partial [Alphaproteobacteria bacterium]|nr:endonuclease/exonuclease/phosphatase family protein [Alphaproteobacteria bacterium]